MTVLPMTAKIKELKKSLLKELNYAFKEHYLKNRISVLLEIGEKINIEKTYLKDVSFELVSHDESDIGNLSFVMVFEVNGEEYVVEYPVIEGISMLFKQGDYWFDEYGDFMHNGPYFRGLIAVLNHIDFVDVIRNAIDSWVDELNRLAWEDFYKMYGEYLNGVQKTIICCSKKLM